jgi:hypothetical protein
METFRLLVLWGVRVFRIRRNVLDGKIPSNTGWAAPVSLIDLAPGRTYETHPVREHNPSVCPIRGLRSCI